MLSTFTPAFLIFANALVLARPAQLPAQQATKLRPSIWGAGSILSSLGIVTSPFSPIKSSGNSTSSAGSAPTSQSSTGKTNMAYFGNWDIYGRNYFPSDMPVSQLSHVLYCFADIDPSTGEIVLSDTYADTDKHYASDSWTESGNNVYGNFKQLFLLKQQNRNLKVSLSIGGWTYSQAPDSHFDPVVQSASLRSAFISSAVTMLENFGLDGIDIDYEYPTTDAMASGFSQLLTDLRTALDAHAASKGDAVPYILTATFPAGESNYNILAPYIPAMNSALTYGLLMAYDFAGSWSNVSDHMANLYPGSASGVNGQDSLNWYISEGFDASKMVFGMPIYGRAFELTVGLEKPFNGVGPGTWEAGVYDYKALPFDGAQVTYSDTLGASYSYDPVKQELVSYDTTEVIAQKSQYIMDNALAGGMFWEISADGSGSNSLVATSHQTFGSLESSQNHLNYPGSIYLNIQNQMASGSGSTSSTSQTPTTPPSQPSTSQSSTPSTTSSSSGSGSGSGQCTGVAAYNSSMVYTQGLEAVYNGHLWQANWWTQDTPSAVAQWGPWNDLGAC